LKRFSPLSGLRANDITIDGKNSGWHNSQVYAEKAGVLVSFVNDEAHRYACLVADSPFQSQA